MNVRLPSLLSDGMVLQRGADVRLWGEADGPFTLAFLGVSYDVRPGEAGAWEMTLHDLKPGGPHEMRIGDITLRDVYVGDVWLCSGQSNMQLPMRRVRHFYPEEMQAEAPYIRQFVVPQRLDFHEPQDALDGGAWAGVSIGTVGDFSAVGYFFAKRLYECYQVPIGLILTAVGGTPIHSWMSHGSLDKFPELQEEAERYANDAYRSAMQKEDAENTEAFFAGLDAADPGLREGWQAADFDDGSWQEQPLLERWDGAGSVWLRKTINIPASLAGTTATLFLGTVLDWDMAYVNGVQVGNTTYRYPPREYTIPSLPAGRCTIALRVISKEGGGFTPGKQYLLSTQEGAVNLNGPWRFRRGAEVAPPEPELSILKKPTGFYNGMIAPLGRYAVRGCIWYQGESDTGSPGRYADKFSAMVSAWRDLWGWELPFLTVELAQWQEGPHWDALRAEQWQALQSVPNTAMAAAYDLGEDNDLHPPGKQPVGDRLARCAMRLVYGEDLPPSPFEIIPLRQ